MIYPGRLRSRLPEHFFRPCIWPHRNSTSPWFPPDCPGPHQNRSTMIAPACSRPRHGCAMSSETFVMLAVSACICPCGLSDFVQQQKEHHKGKELSDPQGLYDIKLLLSITISSNYIFLQKRMFMP